MIDIVERLRNWTQIYPEEAGDDEGTLYQKAADEIERLRAALELFACDCSERELCKFPHACRNFLARAALEEK